MEDETDSDSEEDIEYSGMLLPPLLKQLRGILDEYPDNGQIIKELVQNAEDAEATEMKLMYDGRQINQNPERKNNFKKFFKAPALCVYNDALFSKADWDGIRMLYSSIKEEEALKVGRFGLGFKSVFHLTDNLFIISGDRILFLDPHQKDVGRVCQTVKLKKLDRCKRLNVADLLTALGGLFGISEDTLHTGHYEGTLFWFPLRENKSDLSETLYSERKVGNLYQSFQNEAPITLLFLKSLERIELHAKCTSGSDTNIPSSSPFFSVMVSDSGNDDIRQQKLAFVRSIKNLKGKLPEKSLSCSLHLSVSTVYYRDQEPPEVKNREWLVLNYYKGGQVSDVLRDLAQDRSLSYSPYVGMATPLDHDTQDFRGHVFCFLPLPLTPGETSLTGLPVHVNGFFALNQSRQHLKWPSADQVDMTQQDKSITWNECLLSEVLPDVYLLLIEELIRIAQIMQHNDKMLSLVYSCIPAIDRANERWRKILPPLFHGLLQTYFMRTSEGNWVPYPSAVFSQIEEDADTEEKQAVIELFKRSKGNLVEVPDHVWIAIKSNCSCFGPPKNITPQRLRDLMRTDPTHANCSHGEKMHLLQYAMRDNHYEMLDGLELLPLYNGMFEHFKSSQQADQVIYMCTNEETQLFPGMEHHLADPECKHLLSRISINDYFQLQPLKFENVVSLIDETIRLNFGNDSPKNWYLQTSKVPSGWLEIVWQYLSSHSQFSLNLFKDLNLIPDMSRTPDLITLHRLDGLYILRSDELSDDVVEALKQLGVSVIPSIPSCIRSHQEVMDNYVYTPSSSSVQKLLKEVCRRERGIQQFNKKCGEGQRAAFLDFLSTGVCSSMSKECQAILRTVEMFQEVDGQCESGNGFVCFNKNNLLAPVEPFPVRYPRKLLRVTNPRTRLWATAALGVAEITTAQLTKEVLQIMTQNKLYTEGETDIFTINILKCESWNDTEVRRLIQAVKCIPTETGHRQYITDVFAPEPNLVRLFPSDRFPRTPFNSEPFLSRLRKLGLKGESDLTVEDLYQCAKGLDIMNTGSNTKHCLEMSHTFLPILSKHADKLPILVSGKKLEDHLDTLRWVPVMNTKPAQYPSCLPWNGSGVTLCLPSEVRSKGLLYLLGSVMPLVELDCCPNLVEKFGWDSQPAVESVSSQLECIIERYEDVHKPALLPLVADIYQHLSHNVAQPESLELSLLNTNSCVWTGFGFRPPSMMYVDVDNSDIDLQPYMYCISREFKPLGTFFIRLGCHERQTSQVLLAVQQLVREKYQKVKLREAQEVRQDLELIVRILNRLQMAGDVADHGKILFPVQSSTDTYLDLRPTHECIYCNLEWLENGAGENGEIHAAVPPALAKSLGVPSLTQNLMSDAEDFGDEWGQEEPLTRRIHKLLKDYTDGLSVPKELIQNADDAGANEVCFLYDERTSHDAKTRLLHEGMDDCQGPALWTYNNALFTKEDLKNIRELNGATKECDRSKIGRFGLGFCAVYNLTDVPSFVSGSDVVIFDPQKKHIGKVGLRFNMELAKNRTMVNNLFRPYKGIFGCDIEGKSPHFSGTLFRFPLRTEKQAESSDISGVHYSKAEVRSLLKMFLEAAGNLLLFTQNVEVVKLFNLPDSRSDAADMDLLFEVKREAVKCVPRGISLSTGEPLMLSNIVKHVTEMVENAKGGCKPQRKLQLSSRMQLTVNVDNHGSTYLDVKHSSSRSSWIVSWSSGNSDSMTMALGSDLKGALPLASVAVPVDEENGTVLPVSLGKCPTGFYKEGHIFCFLPLPITTKLPVHINGCFSVTADRKTLCQMTEDDKRSSDQEWNEALMADAVCNAYVFLLESMKDHGVNAKYKYHQLWPCDEKEGLLGTLHNQFFAVAAEKNHNIFCREQQWASLQDSVFLDPEMQSDPDIAKVALDVVVRCKTAQKVMEMPYHIAKCFQEIPYSRIILQEHTLSIKTFFECFFFPNIHCWNDQSRNSLVLFAIKKGDGALDKLLQTSRCIPTVPHGRAKQPRDLVHPKGKVAALFSESEEVFPDTTPGSFIEPSILRRLVSLGMMDDKIPPHWILDRARSISSITAQCVQCGLDRCTVLLRYLQRIDKQTSGLGSILSELRNIKFLPVMAKPSDWPFKWFAESKMTPCSSAPKCGKHTLHLCGPEKQCDEFYMEAPCNLYFHSVKELVGCTELVLDIGRVTGSNYGNDISNVLGVKGLNEEDLPLETVVKQLLIISQTRLTTSLGEGLAILDWKTICIKIYSWLDRICRRKGGIQQVTDQLCNRPVVLVSDTFVHPCKVGPRATHDSTPDPWKGLGFRPPSMMYVKADHSDIDLQPYMYHVPRDFMDLQHFFKNVGCHERQTSEVLLSVQTLVRDKYHEGCQIEALEVKHDLDLIIRILNKLQMTGDVADHGKILFPVHASTCTYLDLRPTHECTYCNLEWLEYGAGEKGEIHAAVPPALAKSLGVPSLTQNLMSDAEDIGEEWGQEEPLTRRLNKLLKDYTDGLSVPKELIQNADDAGANQVCFLYDERTNIDAKTRLLNEGMDDCQGPALWTYNNAMFTKEDLRNIRELNGATKESDRSKIGRFGLGFCAVYNLTDVPSFVSGSDVVIFDPQKKHIGKAGLRFNMELEKNRMMVNNLFRPYKGVFGCDLQSKSPHFHGTLLRLPLRTEKQAESSAISGVHYSIAEVRSLLKIFLEAAGSLLMFTQNVEVVKLFNLPDSRSDAADMDLLFEVKREAVKCVSRGISLSTGEPLKHSNIVKHVTEMIESAKGGGKPKGKVKPVTEIIGGAKGGGKLQGKVKLSSRMKLTMNVNHNGSNFFNVKQSSSRSSWIVSWSCGNSDSMTMALESDLKGALPLASVAVPVDEENGTILPVSLGECPTGFYKEGHIFCFLPLPITTKLPVHINGCFSVTADRKNLCQMTEDDKRSSDHKWNETLMADAVCSAYMFLLESMKDHGVNAKYKYHQLWPCDKEEGLLGTLHTNFFAVAAEKDYNIFYREQQWASLQDSLFLDQEMQSDPDIAQVALYVLVQCQTTQKVMEMPDHIAKCFQGIPYCRTLLQEHTLSIKTFFEHFFFPNIHCWNDKCRNKLILFSIRRVDSDLDELLQEFPCIPTVPHGKTRRPRDLVHPKGRVAALFGENDEVFPDGKAGSFMDTDILVRLVSLGMVEDMIPAPWMPDRARSISAVTAQCAQCGLDRCALLLRFLQRIGKQTSGLGNILSELRNTKFLPVMAKPSDWPFKWFAESKMIPGGSVARCGKHEMRDLGRSEKQDGELYLEAPINLYFHSVKELVGGTELVCNMEKVTGSYDRHVIDISSILCIRGLQEDEIPLDIVVKQLLIVSQAKLATCLGERQPTFYWKTVCIKIYDWLNKICERLREGREQVTEYLWNKSIILVSETFVSPEKVALCATHDSPPDLFSLKNAELRHYGSFLKAVGVREKFEVDDVIQALSLKKMKWLEQPLPEQVIDQVVKLIRVLADAIKTRTGMVIQDYTGVFLPDEDCVLRRADELCLDEIDFNCQMGKHMKYLNSKIAREEAEIIGIKTKRRKHLQMHLKLIPFGQKEKLTTRLRRILDGYPFDVGILRELLQNADDAKATEVHFVKDYRNHHTDTIFPGLAKEVQGPALCVYNNSSFTEKDLEGIQNLGIGSKYSDPTQTGRYGVGFNAVYHLTDIPSFLSRGPDIDETLCMLDPGCEYAPEATPENPGVRLVELVELRKSYPDVFSCYLEKQFGTANGTLFRLPLRTKEMAGKSHSILKSHVTPQMINELINDFKEQMFEALLFTKYVAKITVSTISDEDLKEEYAVRVDMSDEDRLKRQQFFSSVMKESPTRIKDMFPLKGELQRYTGYTLTVSDAVSSESWYVAQNFGFSDDVCVPGVLADAFRNDLLGLLPLGGVAFLVSASKQIQIKGSRHGKAYCVLPLPVLTGLPIHVNGHFALDSESRRNLWKNTGNDYKSEWNKALMKDVIAPAYVSGLQHIKSMTFKDVCSSDELDDRLKKYYAFFPKYETTTDQYWKGLVSAVYNLIVDTHKELFPVQCYTGDHRNASQQRVTLRRGLAEPSRVLKWVSLERQAGCHFPAYFNDLDDQLRIKRMDTEEVKPATRLAQVLARMGMKLLQSPMWLCHTMGNSGIAVHIVNPNDVMCFLKSCNSQTFPPPHDKCQIELNDLIGNTGIQDITTAQWMLFYCARSPNFNNNLNGLPLLVTNDSKVKLFSVNDPIFVTSFCDLLPMSSGSFLHTDMVNLFKDIVGDNRGGEQPLQAVWKEFTLEEFAKLLEYSLPERYKTGTEPICWYPTSQILPNIKWMNRLWEFFGTCLPTLSLVPMNAEEKLGAIKKKLCVIQEWCLLPAIQTEARSFVLFPLSNTDRILDVHSFQPRKLQNALEKLWLPQPDLINVDPTNASLVKSLVATSGRPRQVLDCLYHHRNNIGIMTHDNCEEILKFLSDNVGSLQSQVMGRVNVVDQFRALPLFVTVSGCPTSLTNRNVLAILPSSFPREGISEWSRETKIILLKYTHSLQNETLLGYLGLNVVTNPIDVYCSYILPKFMLLPVDARLHHLKYIRETLLSNSSLSDEYNDEQNKLIRVLSESSVITMSDGTMQKASQFYSPDEKVFKAFIPPSRFPPEPYCVPGWKKFLRLTGMKCDITVSIFVEFAKYLASEGREGVTPDIEAKSWLLVTHLWKRTGVWKEGILEQVSDIRFICPHRVNKEYWKLSPQLDNANDLVAFSGSVPSSKDILVWTSCNLLPSYADPMHINHGKHASMVEEKLGINLNPPINRFILHIQIICKSLKDILSRKKSTINDLDGLMAQLYEHLNTFCKTEATKKELKDTPLVYLKDEWKMVPAHQIILKSLPQDEVKPYLMAAPVYYGPFFPLFEFLGAADHSTANHYAIVLEMLHREVQDVKMHPNECDTMKKAVGALFNKLQTEIDSQITVAKLYLPTRENTLVDSRLLVLSDNASLEERLASVKKCYFLGFKALGIPAHDPIQISHLIPDKFRMRILSGIVEERFDSAVTIVQSDKADIIQRFLQSIEFLQGILRLVRHEQFEKNNPCGDEKEKQIIGNLQRIKVSQVADLQTCLIDSGEVVPNSLEKRIQFVEEDNTDPLLVHHFYFTDPGTDIVQEWVTNMLPLLTLVIDKCTGSAMGGYNRFISQILLSIACPDNISLILDREKIRAYELAPSVHNPFPPLGTFVPVEFHYLLDNSFSEFDVDEYVALEVLDPDIDSISEERERDAVYIYGKIVKKVPGDSRHPALEIMLQLYEVNIGERRERVPAYKLYKFNRSQVKTSGILVEFGSVSGSPRSDTGPSGRPSFPSKEDIFKDLRISLTHIWKLPEQDRNKLIKRLYFKWHPDKNIGQETLCTEVFQYIKNLIALLEQGKDILNAESHSTAKEPYPRPSQSYSDFFSSMHTRAKRDREYFERARRENCRYDEQSNGHFGCNTEGNYGFRGSSHAHYYAYRHKENPMPHEARRWYRQASNDLAAATTFHRSAHPIPAYNWVCYKCHQAVEKALKAAWYSRDANHVTQSHSLVAIATGLGAELERWAQSLDKLVGDHTKMRYPDVLQTPMIPSDVYSREQAQQACEIAQQILQHVSNKYL